ncbi:MAG: cyclic nucleotide-binding domain-containing protein [Thermoanaerobaculia bacterium]
MVFELLSSSSKSASVPDLIARKKYDEALAILKEQLKRAPGDTPLRMQAADVLAAQGKVDNATRILQAIADEFASQGFAAKSIAVLKKIQKLDPSRRDLDSKIVGVFKSTSPGRSGDFRTWKTSDIDHSVVSGVTIQQMTLDHSKAETKVPSSYDAGPIEGFGILTPDGGASVDIGAALQAVAGSKPLSAPPLLSSPPPVAVIPETPRAEEPVTVDIEQFTAAAAVEHAPSSPRVVSPLFDDFSEDELLEVVRGLELLTFEPGDILVTEGEEGDSLYVLTSGTAKAFVRNRKGGSTQVRQLNDGDFFGEISILTGKPRSATITAAVPCELLRLDRETLDSITATRPRIREVLQQFYFERAHNVAEAEIRGLDPGCSETLKKAGLADEEESTAQAAATAAPEAQVVDDATEIRLQYLRNTAIEHSRKQNWNDAVQAWQQYIALRPQDADAGNALGVLFGKLGRWKDAAGTFEHLVELNPTDATNYFNLGISYRQLDALPQAEHAYRKALEIKPDYDKAKQALSAVLARIRQRSGEAQT